MNMKLIYDLFIRAHGVMIPVLWYKLSAPEERNRKKSVRRW